MNQGIMQWLLGLHRAAWAADGLYRLAILAFPVLVGVALASTHHPVHVGTSTSPTVGSQASTPPAPAPPAKSIKIRPEQPLPPSVPKEDRGYHSPFD
ncbi:hypothetical protein [Methylacidimicrobium tartarophylax]|uniref:Uncharacterized protein n=1 Tax=Methylacidimicrobium tartarophylax TaxID=1041768 RepID=A0A5E6M9J9_9BACT|nr:hypothetical protein [Methylacidimicrobium tartarophylax]VVM06232.1 hypothetical protein MAMT_01069 [Methylacidimicrobium tartarophylax]